MRILSCQIRLVNVLNPNILTDLVSGTVRRRVRNYCCIKRGWRMRKLRLWKVIVRQKLVRFKLVIRCWAENGLVRRRRGCNKWPSILEWCLWFSIIRYTRIIVVIILVVHF